MSGRANKTLIGVFVTVAAAIGVAAVIVFGSGKFFSEREMFVAFFEGSVKGLRIGAPVAFRGAPIGQVKSIRVVYNPKDLSFWIPVILETESDKINAMGGIQPEVMKKGNGNDALVERGLRAQLDIQSLVTGQLYVNLDFHPDKPAHFVKPELPQLDIPYDEIPTVRTPLQEIGDIIEKFPLQETVAELRRTLKGVERLVNSPELQEGVVALGNAAKEAESMVENVNGKVGELSGSIEAALGDAREVMATADQAASNLDSLVRELKGEIKPLAMEMKKTASAAESSLKQAEKTLGTADATIRDMAPVKSQIEETLVEIRSAARSLRSLADYLERHPESLLRGKTYRQQ